MYFKRLEMQGFKSFADPVTIDLNDGITCIVGPNGSGKSNISDALRWVIGEQSPKQLRGSKMDDVIFAGTATRKPKGMAEVSLVIDNSTGVLPLEYNEVAVTRRMYRSGESEYLINGNQCRMKDIKELFMDTGIGVDGYSIIGQGKIAEIVSTKPENRREIFEEAAGVVLYKSRKADAERKLQSASTNLERVKDIIGEIEGRIGGLKEESEKATEFIGLRDRNKQLGVNIILHTIESLEKSMASEKEQYDAINEAYEKQVKANEEVERLVEEQRVREAELSEKNENYNKELLTKIDELNIISNKGQLNIERLQTIDRDLARINQHIEDCQNKLEIEKNNFAELEKEEKQCTKDHDDAENNLNKAVIKLNENTEKGSTTRQNIEQNKDKIIEENNNVVSKNAEINTLKNYISTLEERVNQINAEHEGFDENNAKNRSALEDAKNKYNQKQKAFDDANKEIKEIEEKLLSVNKEHTSLTDKIQETSIMSNRAIARKNTIEEMENNYEGYNNAVRFLMQRHTEGIVGTVSDLLKVPDGYEIAVETALGGALQNIICDTDNNAKKSVRLLKDSKAGRATFLPIESIHSSESTLSKTFGSSQGFLGIASEIVSTDEKYKNILNYLLGRVLLADNMDNAVKISKNSPKGFRIVTLEGEVINSNGAITGGQYRNKTANLLERKKEIEVLTKSIEEYKNNLDNYNSKLTSLSNDTKNLKEERASLYNAVQNLQVETSVLKSDMEHAESIVDETSAAATKYDSELETIKSDLDRASDMISKYEKEVALSEENSQKLEKEIEALIEEDSKFRNLIEEDNEEIVNLRLALSEQDTKVLALNEMIERIRDDMTDLEDSIQVDSDEKSELEKQKELLTSSGEASGEKAATLKKQKEELEAMIEACTDSLESLKEEHDNSLSAQKKGNEELENIKNEKYRLEIKNTKNDTIMSNQKEKLWETFEVSYAEAFDMKDENFAITAGNKEAREIKLRLAELGDVNVSSIEEYKSVSKRYDFLQTQEADISKAMDELSSIITNMDKTIKVKFKENFDKVVVFFEQSFKDLFGGGTAELRLEDENNPLESGIEIIAQPPGKKLKNINLMSGGEKTLTAIALMFAVLKAKPTPFCILDEVEAALDEANIERVSNYLKNFKEVQFTLITHQKATMEHADVLYGVTMPEQGISRMLSLKFGDEFDPEAVNQ